MEFLAYALRRLRRRSGRVRERHDIVIRARSEVDFHNGTSSPQRESPGYPPIPDTLRSRGAGGNNGGASAGGTRARNTPADDALAFAALLDTRVH